MSTETCIVRPELIEFKKNVTSFYTIAANADGFKFLHTATATNEMNPSDLMYDFLSPDGTVGTGNLASVWMDKLHVRDLELGAGDASGGGSSLQNIETITMTRNVQANIFMQNGFISNVERFYDLEHLIMRTNDNALIDMNNGDIRQVRDMAFMPDANIDANSAAMSNLDTLVFGANVGTNGPHSKISNLATLDMVSGENARINMTDGHIEMPGSSAVANIGDLLIYHNIIRNERSVNSSSVRIENTDIVDSTMYLSNIHGLYTGLDTMPTAPVRVVDAVFTYSGMPDPLGESRDSMPGIMTVDKVQTDIIEPKANLQGNVNDNNLTLRARGNDGLIKLERVGTGAPIRINNLAEPIDNTDAANKAYVQNIMDRNIQGLKPKEACDTTLFAPGYANVGGYALGSTGVDSDTDPVFSGSWCITHTPNTEGNVDTSDLHLYLPVDTDTSTVSIGNVAYDDAVLNAYDTALTTTDEGDYPREPEKRKIRILFNGFNANTHSLALPTAPDGGTPLSDMTGINGIWEVYESETVNDGNYLKIRLRRAADMNESHEAMNGAYVYIRDSNSPGQKHKNTAFVVQAPNDPIGISTTTYNKGMTVRDDGNVVQLKWVTFNTVNYELDFVNVNGYTKEFIEESVTFRRGGIAMKYDPSDDKKVMVDSEKLRYDVTTHDLHINGNITFSELTTGNADVYIQHNGNIIQNTPDNSGVFINGSRLYSNAEGPFIDTQFVNCTTVTCASDSRLKKNVEPITNGLDLLSKLGAVTYNWNTAPEGADPDYGFIAQQLEENFPSLVSTNHHTGYKAVDYMKITSILAAAVQELAAKVGAH
jgi:hypothetical protein